MWYDPLWYFFGNVLQPSIVNAIFLFLGSAFFLYIKARQGPGPFVSATILACICLGMSYLFLERGLNELTFPTDVTLTTSALFPYAYYKVCYN